MEVRELAKRFKMSIEVVESLVEVIGFNELLNILKLKQSDLNYTIRFNLLKSSSEQIKLNLLAENISVKQVKQIPEAFIVTEGKRRVGSSFSYLSGEVMPQGYGSMLSVHLLDPKPGETILDLSAAPGGKSCFIGERMKNRGVLIANEYSYARSKSLIHNLSRHGIENVITTIQEGSKFQSPMKFDKILIDAPCSGDGLIVSQPETRSKKSLEISYMLQKTQRSLLRNALSLLKPNGICVYSTCAINSIENEKVIQPFLSKINIVQIDSPGSPGYDKIDSSFQFTRRLLPSQLSCDGFFIAKIQRK